MKPEASSATALRDAFANHRAGRMLEAELGYRRALAASPGDANATHLLGMLLHQQDRNEEAIELLQKAVSLAPGSAEFQNSLGGALARIGRTAEALSHLRESVRLDPRYVEARSNLGLALHHARKYSEAIAELRSATALRPNYAEAYHQLGNALRAAGLAQEAAESHRQAISISPRFSAAYHELAADLCDLGSADEAIAAYRKVLELNPDSLSAYSDVLFCLHYSDRYMPGNLLKEALGYGRRFGQPAEGERNGDAASFRKTSCVPVSLRRLRVGYLSPDFRRHTIRHIIEPILESHDRQQVEVFCYASVHQPDDVTSKLANLSEHWTDVTRLSDDEAAEHIASDAIDVLVDLAGHMGDTRLAVLARRPARVQLQLGYPGTTGLSAVDYRFADAHSMPSEAIGFYSEKTLYLPDCAWLYKPADDAPNVGPLPADRNGFVTFGCLNKLVKVSGRTLNIWATVLGAVPNSRLLLLSPQKNDRLLDSLARRGIDLKRVELAPRRSRSAYLELFNQIDIALDPMPYNGETTTCDGLWMGVPLVTLAETAFVSRRGASHLTNLGLNQLIAQTPEDYVAIAASLASDLPLLAGLRSTLRDRMRNSPITNGPEYTRNLESLFRKLA